MLFLDIIDYELHYYMVYTCYSAVQEFQCYLFYQATSNEIDYSYYK